MPAVTADEWQSWHVTPGSLILTQRWLLVQLITDLKWLGLCWGLGRGPVTSPVRMRPGLVFPSVGRSSHLGTECPLQMALRKQPEAGWTRARGAIVWEESTGVTTQTRVAVSGLKARRAFGDRKWAVEWGTRGGGQDGWGTFLRR